RGLSRREALESARREFGNTGALREAGRDARGSRWLGVLWGDVHYAFRHFRRTKAMTMTIVLILMLGVTVNAVVFAIADGVINRPPPGVPDDPALVTLRATGTMPRDQSKAFSFNELQQYAKRTELFESVA